MRCLNGSWLRHTRAVPVLDNSQAASPGDSKIPHTVLWFQGRITNHNSQISETTRVLSRMYARYGPEMAHRIYGSCSWVIWDSARNQLVLTSDRLGHYPVYFHLAKNGWFYFADQIASILTGCCQPVELNDAAIIRHLYTTLPEPGQTFYKHISQLKPGEILLVSENEVDSKCYWQMRPRPALKLVSRAEYTKTARRILFEVIGEYRESNPSAITLSSGLDSTCVAAGLKQSGSDLSAISWCSPGVPEADESGSINAVAGMLGIPVHWIRADQLWPLCNSHGIDSQADSPLRMFYTEGWDATFSSSRKYGFDTLYTGAGGDELFGRFITPFADLLLTGRFSRACSGLSEFADLTNWPYLRMIRRTLISPIVHALLPGRAVKKMPTLPWLGNTYKPQYRQYFNCEKHTHYRMLPNRVQRFKYISSNQIMYGVASLNRRALQCGTELVHPLLDHRLLEFAAALPVAQCFNRGLDKAIVRNAMRGFLPDSILGRKHKIYPGKIGERALKFQESNKVLELMTGMKAAELGYVDENRLRLAYSDYVKGKSNDTGFWNAITLEAWLRQHIPGS